MIGNNLWTADARRLLLHLLPQCTYHDPAEIRGSPEALRRLGEALLRAAGRGRQTESHEVEMMASDGEGYWITIRPMSDEQMGAGPLPYAQLGQPWENRRCQDCPKDRPHD